MEKHRQDYANEKHKSSTGPDPRRDRVDPNRPQPGREQPMQDPHRDPDRDEPRRDPPRRERRDTGPSGPEEPMDGRSD